MSILDYFRPDHRPQDPQSAYKTVCCKKYTTETQCRRCPFKHITDTKDRDRALHECWDKRRGTYTWHGIKIEYTTSV